MLKLFLVCFVTIVHVPSLFAGEFFSNSRKLVKEVIHEYAPHMYILLRRGNLPTEDIFIAAENGQAKFFEALYSYHNKKQTKVMPNLDFIDKKAGESPLTCSIKNKQYKITDLLLKLGLT